MGIWDKVFKNRPSKICERQSLKNFTWSILEYFVPYENCSQLFGNYTRIIFEQYHALMSLSLTWNVFFVGNVFFSYFLVYMRHETNACFLKQARDFSVLIVERAEVSYILNKCYRIILSGFSHTKKLNLTSLSVWHSISKKAIVVKFNSKGFYHKKSFIKTVKSYQVNPFVPNAPFPYPLKKCALGTHELRHHKETWGNSKFYLKQ